MKSVWRSLRFYREFGISRSKVSQLLNQFEMSDWHFQVMDEWPYWHEPRTANDWIIKNVPPSAKILDTGCGIGHHLLRLHRHNYRSLYGSEINTEVAKAARGLLNMANAKVPIFEENALMPEHISYENFDVILAQSWIYHQKDSSLEDFLKTYQAHTNPGAKVIINFVDKKFEQEKKNKWNTHDWELPEDKRRMTQYLLRHNEEDIEREAQASGFKVIHKWKFHKKIPKILCVLEKQ